MYELDRLDTEAEALTQQVYGGQAVRVYVEPKNTLLIILKI